MSQNKTLPSLALVGAGRWGKNLARNFYQLGVLHTLCDSNEKLLDDYQKEYPDIHLTSNYNSLLTDPNIDKIAIAAPAAHHYALAKKALEHHKDLYVEKPLCLHASEADELIALAQKNGCILMVGHLLQYHPCIQKIQELIAAGELGKIQVITSNRLNLGCIRTEENVLWSFAPHDISVILSLCGNELPTSVSCSGGAYISEGIADSALTCMEFEGGVRAHIHVSWLHPYKEQKLSIVGSQGMLLFDDTQPWDNKLTIVRHPIHWTHGKIPVAHPLQPEKITVPQAEPLKEECRHFLLCCQERTSPRTNGEEGRRVLQVLEAAQHSLDNANRKCTLPLPTFFAHPSAFIDPDATIGPGTKIWHCSHIMKEATLGKNCNIGQNVVISPNVILGYNVKVQNNVSIYSGVVCEDDVFLGPSMVFTNVKNPRSEVNRRGQYLTTTVRQGATIGANATIVCGIEIGAYAFIGAGAVVTKDVKPYALMVGNPARQCGWMSRHGEKLALPVLAPEHESLTACCPATQEEYTLQGDILSLSEQILAESLYDSGSQ